METTCEITEWVERIKTTKNFRELDDSFIEQIIRQAQTRGSEEKEILSSVKTTIQDVTNQFRTADISYRDLIAELDNAHDHELTAEERGLFAADLLRRHAAAKERIPFIRRYYQEIFSHLPTIESVLDVGCGLNPVAVTFMPVSSEVHYSAVDLPADLVDFLNDFFRLIEIPGVAIQSNLLNGIPDIDADLTLIQKTIPVLERAEKGAGRRLFDAIRSPNAVLSFKTVKKQKQAKAHHDYIAEYESILAASDWGTTKLVFPNETVFVLKR